MAKKINQHESVDVSKDGLKDSDSDESDEGDDDLPPLADTLGVSFGLIENGDMKDLVVDYLT